MLFLHPQKSVPSTHKRLGGQEEESHFASTMATMAIAATTQLASRCIGACKNDKQIFNMLHDFGGRDGQVPR
jgi:hypothetical protein